MDRQPYFHTKRHIKLFNTLAGIYGWGFNMQYKLYKRWLEKCAADLIPGPGTAILDIGCGTGAWAAVWSDLGMRVTGIDPSPKMIQQSRKRNTLRDILFKITGTGFPYEFEDDSFDLVTATLVLHGLRTEVRMNILREMRRISRGSAVILDYNGRRHPLIDVIEWLEGGDYFHFQQHGWEEMKSVFTSVEKRDLGAGLCLYIGK